MKTNPDDNAFQEGSFGKTNTLTKREYFAAMVLQGLCSLERIITVDKSELAVEIADKLIDELNKGIKDE
jgi:hypothetical protein